jgi:hypothetical protein
MPLPETIRVKLSSEAAESITLTPVVVQELPLRELVEHMLAIAGKDLRRIREILLRGTLVSGASRFRWTGLDADIAGIEQILATFPDPDPSLPFAAERCTRALLRGGRQVIDIPREAAERKGLFQRATFWDLLMKVTGGGAVAYHGYSYRERADRYLREFTVAEIEALRAGSESIRYTTLRDQVRSVAFLHAELHVRR